MVRRGESVVVASAPGKVLLAGGYLILDREHQGMVLALDARFYSAVKLSASRSASAAAAAAAEAATTEAAGRASTAATLEIVVHSPQLHEHRRYRFLPPTTATAAPTATTTAATTAATSAATTTAARLEALPLTPSASIPKPNPYVEVPLLYTLALIHALHGDTFASDAAERTFSLGGVKSEVPLEVRLEVTLAADNGFYSHVNELKALATTHPPPPPAALHSLSNHPPLVLAHTSSWYVSNHIFRPPPLAPPPPH